MFKFLLFIYANNLKFRICIFLKTLMQCALRRPPNTIKRVCLCILAMTLVNASNPDAVSEIQSLRLSNGNSVSAFSIKPEPSFYAALDPAMTRAIEVSDIAKKLGADINENFKARFAMLASHPTKNPEYEALGKEYAGMKATISSIMTELEEIHASLEAQMPSGRASAWVKALSDLNMPRVTARTQKLGKNSVSKTDGTKFVRMGNTNTFAPVVHTDSSAPVEDCHAKLVDETKRTYLNTLIELVAPTKKMLGDFSERMLRSEAVVNYDLELRWGNRDPQKLKDHAKNLISQYPENSDRRKVWHDLFEKHLREYLGQPKDGETTPSPEQLEKKQRQQLVAIMLADQEAQRELDERKLEQQKIRELRLQQETFDDGDEEQLAAVAHAEIPAEPMEVLAFDRFDVSELEALAKIKYEAAIAEIKLDREPADFRGAIKLGELNILHCGLGGGLRLYYTISKRRVLDVSNHDMNRLELIARRFMEELL